MRELMRSVAKDMMKKQGIEKVNRHMSGMDIPKSQFNKLTATRNGRKKLAKRRETKEGWAPWRRAFEMAVTRNIRRRRSAEG